MTNSGNPIDIPQPVYQVNGRKYAPRFIRTPWSDLQTLERTIRRLGIAAGFLGSLALLATCVLMFVFGFPHEVRSQMWIYFGVVIAAASAFGSTGGVLTSRRAIRWGYLDLWTARSARAGLAGACIASLLGAVLAVALLARVAWDPPSGYTPAAEFWWLVAGYVAVLVVATTVNCICFARLRPLLWALPHLAAYRGHRIAPWEKRN